MHLYFSWNSDGCSFWPALINFEQQSNAHLFFTHFLMAWPPFYDCIPYQPPTLCLNCEFLCWRSAFGLAFYCLNFFALYTFRTLSPWHKCAIVQKTIEAINPPTGSSFLICSPLSVCHWQFMTYKLKLQIHSQFILTSPRALFANSHLFSNLLLTWPKTGTLSKLLLLLLCWPDKLP